MTNRPRSMAPERGQALAEFALVFPIVVLLMVAAVDIGRAAFAYNSITNGAREGARLAIVNQDVALITQRATTQTAIAEVDVPNVTVTFRRSTPNADPNANAVCATLAVGCLAIVRFETTYRPITPIIQSFLFPSGATLVATSVEALEFICPSAAIAAANCPKQP